MPFEKRFVVDCEASHAPLLSPRHICKSTKSQSVIEGSKQMEIEGARSGLGVRELPDSFVEGC
jgi:hypothetical protein